MTMTQANANARLRRRLADVAQRIIDALDALDAPDEDLEDSHDREDDRADIEPSLGATLDVDQMVAWGPDRVSYVEDGEATQTEDDVKTGLRVEDWKANRAASDTAKVQLRALLKRREPLKQGVAR
jgi:hypothetical protein